MFSDIAIYRMMVLVRALEGNTRCILCSAPFTSTQYFGYITSPRGRDLKALVYNVFRVTPINGVLCRRTCQAKLQTLEKRLEVYRKAISANTCKVEAEVVIICIANINKRPYL